MSTGYTVAKVMAFLGAGAMGLFLLRSGPIARPVEFGVYLLLIAPYLVLYTSRSSE